MATHIVQSSLNAAQVLGYKAVLCDLDGCLIADGAALPGAQAFCVDLGHRLWIVSNNSSDTARTLSKKLEELGICIPQTQILLAGEHAIGQLAQRSPRAKLQCLTDTPVKNKAEELGFTLVGEQAQFVLLGRMAAFNLTCLKQAVTDLASGAQLLVANTDKTHPGASGNPVPETGAWLAAVRACLPNLVFESFGKPATNLLVEALKRSGAHPEEAVFVGDNEETDGKAAALMGMDFIEVNPFPKEPLREFRGSATC